MTFDRITVDPDLMGGAPTVRGLRIPVATLISMVADGMTVDGMTVPKDRRAARVTGSC